MIVEALDPAYLKKLQESLLTLANALQNLTRGGFDEAYRPRVRVEYLDDGWLKVRTDPASAFEVSIVEALRELSWALYSQAEASALLSRLAPLARWGRDAAPAWVHGDEVEAPPAGTTLVSKSVGAGKLGYVYGLLISAEEPNSFRLSWTSGGAPHHVRLPLASAGSLSLQAPAAINEGLPADGGSTISISNVNPAGSGKVYQARLLYAEV